MLDVRQRHKAKCISDTIESLGTSIASSIKEDDELHDENKEDVLKTVILY